MKVFLDTSVIVEIDRKNEAVIEIIKKLIDDDHEILISTITLSEILTGSYLRRDFRKSVETAKKIMGQFVWIDFDAEIAEKTSQYLAYLITEGRIIEYQDVAIAATAKLSDADYFLTLNKKHFDNIPEMKGIACEPKDLLPVLRKR